MSKSNLNVVIGGGRKLFREGLRLLLERESEIKVGGEAEDTQDVPRLVNALTVDVVILNLAPSSLNDLETIRSIVRVRSETRLILLTITPPIELVQEFIEAGATGCLTKDSAGSELVAAVEKVSRGELYLSPALMDRIVNRYVVPSRQRASERALAPRERQILRMIAAGSSAKEIAVALSVSNKTVETHRRRIMHKLNRHSVAELTKYAVLEGLTTLESAY